MRIVPFSKPEENLEHAYGFDVVYSSNLCAVNLRYCDPRDEVTKILFGLTATSKFRCTRLIFTDSDELTADWLSAYLRTLPVNEMEEFLAASKLPANLVLP